MNDEMKLTRKYSELSHSEKERIRNDLYKRYGKKCHYCLIEEDAFRDVWGATFYCGLKRGRRLEIDHKDPEKRESCDENDMVLACALCNMAKTDKLNEQEFMRVGKVINEIWQEKLKTKTKSQQVYHP